MVSLNENPCSRRLVLPVAWSSLLLLIQGEVTMSSTKLQKETRIKNWHIFRLRATYQHLYILGGYLGIDNSIPLHHVKCMLHLLGAKGFENINHEL